MDSYFDEFDLDRSIAEAWAAFTGRLGEVVSMMEPGARLTINTRESELPAEQPFISFDCDDEYNIRSEVSGNAYLSLDFLLTDAQLAKLAELGWHEPEDGPNWWRTAEQDAYQLVAEEAVAVLIEVFDIEHPVFLAPDQLSEILNPPASAIPMAEAFPSGDLTAVVPTSADHLRQLISLVLNDELGQMPILTDEGEFAIRAGTAMVFIRVTEDTREAIIFSPIVHDIEGRTRAAELLADLNAHGRMVKFMLIGDKVLLSLSLLTYPFVPAHLKQVLAMVAELADEMDERLAAALRGETFFGPDDSPPPEVDA
ncbi:MAG: YbjN domain-containing protein [Propionibacteriaceae bacterium]|jgi:hypothetical protein|nr:YbjN domain-containing protein [Propionibacteriaceae bacterium]